ncbi:hypothetical protein KP509_07G087300 [Ceratopteris richardii]|uniref:Enoyl reductase (ER) domain-containing protein n=2 Tax=Ceratopteris richardii TaxID=49495 RepID=A0A8T2UNF9_CERRI|nr:hypothetical protein KP509_07G087300 [Ceratopteris richardii]
MAPALPAPAPGPIKCKAAVAWGPNEELVIEDIEVDAPHAGEVRIRMVAVSLCHTDISFLGMVQAQFPRILGHEGAGIVESVGEGVKHLKVGDHVLPLSFPECGECANCKSEFNNLCEKYVKNMKELQMLHPIDQKSRFSVSKAGETQQIFSFLTSIFSEYTVVSEDCCAKIHEDAPFEKACIFACAIPTGFGAAWNTVKVEKGSTVAIVGLGTIGLAVADATRIAGASRIIGIDINSGKFDLAKRFGVTECINPKDCQSPIQKVLQDLTNGGVDYFFECVGKVDLVEAALESTREGSGKTVVLGFDGSCRQLSFNPLLLFGRSIMSSVCGGYKGRSHVPGLVDKLVKKELFVDNYITHTLPFKEINKAIALLNSGTCLRCVMTMG